MAARKIDFAATATDIERDLHDLSLGLIERALNNLLHIGIKEGALVRRDDKTYRVTAIEVTTDRWCGFALRLVIYGNQLRADGTFGSHVHYVGSPATVSPTAL